MSRDSSSSEGSTGEDDRFADATIDRRTFVKLSAATGAALALPGNATADTSAAAFEADYQYVQNHTPADHAVPTLVRFEQGADPTALETFDENAISTVEPEPAAYGRLTAAEAEAAADLPTASQFQFSPGSNPFWRIDYYPFGVFPEARRSVDFIGFEQLKDGLAQLETDYPNRIRVKEYGKSPGHLNEATSRTDPKGMYVAEVTNFDSEASFEEKEKIFYSLSLHGLERAGAEAGARIIENICRGDDHAGDIPDLLDEAVLLFGFTNPDGWVARNPQYESGWQLLGPDGGAPVAPLYERGSAGVFDTNRQYPSVGYITPAHYPGDPSNFSDDPAAEDRVEETKDRVPDALAIVEHFRGYENLTYGADLHGGPVFNEFVLGLISQDQYNTREMHEVYEMCRVIDDVLEDALSEWATAGDVKTSLLGETKTGLLFGVLPEEAFDYATIYDTIDYTVSGAMLDWMSHPEELGGLGMTTLDFEMAFSHMTGGNVYNPELLRMEVTGYRTAIRTIARFAVTNSDTPNTEDQFEAKNVTGGDKVAYVTTGPVGGEEEYAETGELVPDDDGSEDALRRHSGQLNFSSAFGELATKTYSGTIGPGASSQGSGAGTETRARKTFKTKNIPDGAAKVEATLSWQPDGQDLEFYLEGPEGRRLAAATTAGNPERISSYLYGEGEYTFIVETWANAAANYEIEATFLGDTGEEATTTTTQETQSGSVSGGGTAAVTQAISGENLHSLTVHTHAHQAFFDLELVSPSGEVVRSFDAVGEKRAGGKCCGLPEWVVDAPETGEWTVRVKNLQEDAKRFDVQFDTLASSAPNPDPRPAVGFDQYDYDVTPFRFFEDYDEAIADDGEFVPVTVEEVADGKLVKEDFDHAVVIHDYGANKGADYFASSVPGYTFVEGFQPGFDEPDYVDALDTFVDEGGNLVLTDTGVHLLGEMENDLVDGSTLKEDAFTTNLYNVARYKDKNLDHPLMTDIRPIQNQLWKVAPLGYKVNAEAPMYLVDEESFTSAAKGEASVAGRTDGLVATATVTDSDDRTGIHTISSLLPPATQKNLHPFGMVNYTPTFAGYLVLTSALDFYQRRTVDGEVTNYGAGKPGADDPGGSGPTAEGSRGDTNSPYTPGDTHQVDITITELSEEATVTDSLPSANWEKVGGDGTQDGDTVDFGDIGPVGEDEDTKEVKLRYFVEVPNTNGEAIFGPAQADDTDFGGTNTVRVVGGNPAAGSEDSSADSSLTNGHGFSADTL